MSWKKYKKYNRTEDVEAANVEWNYYCEEIYEGGRYDWEDGWWWADWDSWYYDDNPQNMGEYHSLKLLTLLRLLSLQDAKKVLKERGWL